LLLSAVQGMLVLIGWLLLSAVQGMPRGHSDALRVLRGGHLSALAHWPQPPPQGGDPQICGHAPQPGPASGASVSFKPMAVFRKYGNYGQHEQNSRWIEGLGSRV
jgi:hypothetical protein